MLTLKHQTMTKSCTNARYVGAKNLHALILLKVNRLVQAIVCETLPAMTDCPLRTNSVYPWLSENPLVFLIGEAPGEEEDKTGIPFVGRAGKKLRSWLPKFKLDDCFAVGNACLHRPYDESPDGTRTKWNRVPTEQEMSACKPILDRYLSRAQSKVVVFVGGTSAKFLGEYKGTV